MRRGILFLVRVWILSDGSCVSLVACWLAVLFSGLIGMVSVSLRRVNRGVTSLVGMVGRRLVLLAFK